MCVSFSSPLRRSVCVCVWVGWGEGDATLPPQQLITTTYQQEHPFSCTNQQNKKKITFNYKFSNCFLVRNISYTKIGFYTYLKKKAKKIKTLFKVYLKLSLWLFNLCMSRVGGRWRHPLPHNNLSQQLFNKNTPSLARISQIKKSLLIINFPIVFQFATFPIQKLNFIRT